MYVVGGKADSQPTSRKRRDGPRLCENSDVELTRRNFVSIRLNRKRPALAVPSKGGQGRKQFCAFSARARFHTAWTHNRHSAIIAIYPVPEGQLCAPLRFRTPLRTERPPSGALCVAVHAANEENRLNRTLPSVEDFPAHREGIEGSDLIGSHEAAIALNVSRKDSSQAALHFNWVRQG
jgi:hypothetical protein